MSEELTKTFADLPDRIAKHIEVDDVSGCWNWTNPRSLIRDGRGYVWLNGKNEIHHRAVWILLRGPIPKGTCLCHHCDNLKCANPEHIYIGDRKTNAQDMVDRGRLWAQKDPERAKRVGRELGLKNTWARAEGNPNAKLTEQQVLLIADSPKPTRELAEAYGVSFPTIQNIRNGTAWKSVTTGKRHHLTNQDQE